MARCVITRTWEGARASRLHRSGVKRDFETNATKGDARSVRDIVEFFRQAASTNVLSDRLCTLWAMQQVESLVSDCLEDIYAEYRVVEGAC